MSSQNGWLQHEEQHRRAWLRLTPEQRLQWLEQAKAFVREVAEARAAGGKPASQR